MDCPKCVNKLKPIQYSGVRIFSCSECSGHLVENGRVKKIEKRINKDPKALVREIVQNEKPDTIEVIRCPRCRNRMDKQEVNAGRTFQKDSCRNCDAVWLDGGELAEIQLAYESNEQTQEIQQMRERLENMTAQEKADYEANIAALVDMGSPLEAATQQATNELIAFYFWRGFLTL